MFDTYNDVCIVCRVCGERMGTRLGVHIVRKNLLFLSILWYNSTNNGISVFIYMII